MKAFLSHSSKDAPIVNLIENFLERTLHIDRGDIYYSSFSDQIDAGDDFIQSIRDSLRASDIVICFVSENYLNSVNCLMEMGAAWAFVKYIIPILVPPVKIERLEKTMISKLQFFNISNPDGVGLKIYNTLINKKLIDRISIRDENIMINNSKTLTKKVIQHFEDKELSKVNLDAAILLQISQNGNPAALTHSRNSKVSNIYLDFSPNTLYSPPVPSFVSLVAQFPYHQDFSILANPKYFFHFSICSPNDSVSKITFELKATDKLIKIADEPITISSSRRDVYIGSKEIRNTDLLKDIAEICYVIIPADSKAPYGNVMIEVHGIVKIN